MSKDDHARVTAATASARGAHRAKSIACWPGRATAIFWLRRPFFPLPCCWSARWRGLPLRWSPLDVLVLASCAQILCAAVRCCSSASSRAFRSWSRRAASATAPPMPMPCGSSWPHNRRSPSTAPACWFLCLVIDISNSFADRQTNRRKCRIDQRHCRPFDQQLREKPPCRWL